TENQTDERGAEVDVAPARDERDRAGEERRWPTGAARAAAEREQQRTESEQQRLQSEQTARTGRDVRQVEEHVAAPVLVHPDAALGRERPIVRLAEMACEDIAPTRERDEEIVDRTRLGPHQRQERDADAETEDEVASSGGHGRWSDGRYH